MDIKAFHETEHVFIEFQGLVRVEPALEEDLGTAKILGLANFLLKFLVGQDASASILGSLEKGAELTGRDTDIGVVPE